MQHRNKQTFNVFWHLHPLCHAAASKTYAKALLCGSYMISSCMHWSTYSNTRKLFLKNTRKQWYRGITVNLCRRILSRLTSRKRKNDWEKVSANGNRSSRYCERFDLILVHSRAAAVQCMNDGKYQRSLYTRRDASVRQWACMKQESAGISEKFTASQPEKMSSHSTWTLYTRRLTSYIL